MAESGSFEFYKDYSESVKNLQPEFYNETKRLLENEILEFTQKYGRRPKILDVGSAGLIPFDANFAQSVTCLDLFDKPGDVHLPANCQWKKGDIRSNEIITAVFLNEKFDFIIMGSLLHHLCDENCNIGIHLYNSFRNCYSLLSPDGKICIFESTCSNFVARLEDALWKYYSYFLVHLFQFTYVRMLSDDEIFSALNAAGLTYEKITFQQPKYIAQMYWRVPAFLVPLKISAIFAEKIA